MEEESSRRYCIVLRERKRTQRERESGGDSGREAPVTIPNTEVKPSSAEDTERESLGK